MMAMVDHIDATQEDREAAAAYWKISRIGNDETQRRYLSGEADGAFIVQSFTRHRLASTAAIATERDALAKRVEALEGALKQIWTRRYGDWCEIARKALGEG